jgi:hypothetical protein
VERRYGVPVEMLGKIFGKAHAHGVGLPCQYDDARLFHASCPSFLDVRCFQIWIYLLACFYVLFFLQRKKSTKRNAVQEETYGFP